MLQTLRNYKNSIDEKIVEKFCIPFMTSYARRGSEVLNHFISENKRIVHDEAEAQAVKDAEKILSLISVTDETPNSISHVLELVRNAIDFKLLSPLTFADDEFIEIDGCGLKQNTRRSSIFKRQDGTIRDIDAIQWDVRATAVIKNGELVKKIWPDDVSRYSTGLAFMYEKDTQGNVTSIIPVESQALIKDLKNYYGEIYKIPAFEVLDITNEEKTGAEIYTLFDRKCVSSFFTDRFDFIDIRTDDSVYERMQKMIEEDLKTVEENDFIGKYEYLSFGPKEKRADDTEDTQEEEPIVIYYDDKHFIWNEYVYDDIAQSIVNSLIDADVDNRDIKVTLDDENSCVCLEIFYEDGTQFDTICEVIEKNHLMINQIKKDE